MTTPAIAGNKYRIYGLWSILISFVVYCTGIVSDLKENEFFGVFMINYMISVVYFCGLWFTGGLRGRNNGRSNLYLSLVLFLISAYALNRLIPVFELSVDWLGVLLVLSCCAYCGLSFYEKMNGPVRTIIAFFLGIGGALFLYLSIYLLPLYPVSVPAMLALGISIHSFIPLLFFIFTLVWLFRDAGRKAVYSFLSGAGLSVLVVILYCIQWQHTERIIASRYQKSLLDEDTALPAWIKVAQVLPHNWFTERYMKVGLVYSKADKSGDWMGFGIPSRNFDEVKKHDPLIMIATFFSSGNGLTEDERVKILEAEFDSRHKTEDRLWSGTHLETSNVISNIRIWPQYRMAYTEKTLTVQNKNSNEERLRMNEEAIYTFHLPEGGVVTSLSLWINGTEAKGVLTTKGKADSAYRQIVGVESRDPSVVHWQEGNRVSVRVFPVPAGGNRIFKIGVTAPLAWRENKLAYENIYFEGPDASEAKEIVQVSWAGPVDNELMKGFEETGNSRYSKERKYEKDWELRFPSPGINLDAFSFSGQTYRVSAYKPDRESVPISNIYLDVNKTWTEQEFMDLTSAWKEKTMFVYDDGLVKVEERNRKHLFSRLSKRHFTLFPMQAITDPGHALLVTKSGKESPNISDLKETAFAASLEAWLNRGVKLCIFNLGPDLNPYLKTLKEHRAFRYEQGNAAAAISLSQQHVFAIDAEDTGHVVIDNAGIVLSRTADSSVSTAPDHLMRLFAYNHLMQQLKQGLFVNHEADSALVAEAQQAYVVTPLSSLVVLETSEDYERFNIKDSKNSLSNASLKSKGAVPEPHEWALIIISGILLIGVAYKDRIRKLWIQ